MFAAAALALSDNELKKQPAWCVAVFFRNGIRICFRKVAT